MMQNACAAILAGLLVLASTPKGGAQTVDELYAAGVKARQEQRLDEAAELLRRALTIKTDNSDALVQLGFVELGRGNLAVARESFSKALALAPDYADARYGFAEIEFRAGNLDKASDLAEALALEQPGNADVAALLKRIEGARRAAANEATDRPRSRAKRQPRPPPDPVAALTEQARRLRAANNLAEAERIYRKALKLSPRNTDLLVSLGFVVGAQQRFSEADQLFDQALAMQPGLLDARIGKVRLAIWQGDVQLARSRVDEVLASAPANTEALGLEARVLLLEGDSRTAEQAFERVLSTDPRNAEALVGIGDARRARWDEEGAREAYRKALALQPGSRDIEDRLAQPAPKRWRIDIGSEVSRLTMGRGTWTDSAVALSYRLTPQTTLSARTRLATRFGQTDLQIEGRIDQAFSPSLTGYALLAATPDSDFLAEYSAGAGASWQALRTNGSVGPVYVNVDARFDKFDTAEVTTISPWLQTYFFDQRLGLSARWVHAFDDTGVDADGYVLRGDLVVVPGFNVFAGYADAPEIDDGSLIPTETVFGGVSWDVGDGLTLRASVAHERRPAFDRDTFGLSLTKRF
jgi:YaiO family outer membrane protein